MNENAAERKPTRCSGRVLNMHARDRPTNSLGDCMAKQGDLGFEFRTLRSLPFENGDENRQLCRVEGPHSPHIDHVQWNEREPKFPRVVTLARRR